MDNSQKPASHNDRPRLSRRGLNRIEVLAPESHRHLIGSLAAQLAEDGPDAAHILAAVGQTVGGESSRKGELLAALRSSPLVGSDLDLVRDREERRDVDI